MTADEMIDQNARIAEEQRQGEIFYRAIVEAYADYDYEALGRAVVDRFNAAADGFQVVQSLLMTDPRAVAAAISAVIPGIIERIRQVEVEGWATAHDDAHVNGELARAAASYAISSQAEDGWRSGVICPLWPWSEDWWRPSNGPRDIDKAIALLIAERERLARRPKMADAIDAARALLDAREHNEVPE